MVGCHVDLGCNWVRRRVNGAGKQRILWRRVRRREAVKRRENLTETEDRRDEADEVARVA